MLDVSSEQGVNSKSDEWGALLSAIGILAILGILGWLIFAPWQPPKLTHSWTLDDGTTCYQFEGARGPTCTR